MGGLTNPTQDPAGGLAAIRASWVLLWTFPAAEGGSTLPATGERIRMGAGRCLNPVRIHTDRPQVPRVGASMAMELRPFQVAWKTRPGWEV